MQNEKTKIVGFADADVTAILRDNNAFIAGGAITSVMTNKPINDLDVYFRNKVDFTNTINELLGLSGSADISSGQAWAFNVTDKSLMLKSDGNLIQLICYRFFDTPEDLFKSYDFTINMGAYDLKKDNWEFHPDFFRHNSQKYLHFNSLTDYPIVSAMRVQKYKERGYSISKAQMLKIMMTITDLQINSWGEFKDHVGGMYGLTVDDVFDTTQPFSKLEAVYQLDDIKIPEHVETTGASVDSVVEKLAGRMEHKMLADFAREFKTACYSYPSWVEHIEEKYRPK